MQANDIGDDIGPAGNQAARCSGPPFAFASVPPRALRSKMRRRSSLVATAGPFLGRWLIAPTAPISQSGLFECVGRLLVMRFKQLCILACPFIGNEKRQLPHLLSALAKVICVHLHGLPAGVAIPSQQGRQ